MKHFLIPALIALYCTASAAVLFDNGKTEWNIYISEENSPTEAYAAEELSNYLFHISNCKFEIIKNNTVPASGAIVIGSPLSMPNVKQMEKPLKLDFGGEQKVAVHTLDGNLYLCGRTDRGALYAVYTFLQETLGVRWFWPSTEPEGEFVIRRDRFELPSLTVNIDPAIKYRGYHFLNTTNPELETWLARNFGNIIRDGKQHGKKALPERMKKGIYIHSSGHNIDLNDNEVFQQHPDWFAEVMGKRIPRQLCWSNPEVDTAMYEKFVKLMETYPEITILGFYPADNQDYCRCEKCRQTDVSTTWFNFLRRLTNRLHDTFPQLRFTSIAYQGYIDYPKCDMTGYEYIEYAPYGRCFVHNIESGCDGNNSELKRWTPWLKSGIATGVYGYEFDVLAPGRMIPMYHWLSDQLRFFKNNKVCAVIPEIHGTYGTEKMGHMRKIMRLTFYLYSRLMWDPTADVSLLIRDFCNYVYPAAAEEIYSYHMLLDRAWSAQKQDITSYFNSPITTSLEFLSNEIIMEGMHLLDLAGKKIAGVKDNNERIRQKKELDYEQKLFEDWINVFWSASDNILNVPQEQAVFVALGKSSNFTVKWRKEAADFSFLLPEMDNVTVRMTAPDWSVREEYCKLVEGKGTLAVPDELKHRDCRQVLISWTAKEKPAGAWGKEKAQILYFNKIPTTVKKILISVPDQPVPKKNKHALRSALLDAAWQPAMIEQRENNMDGVNLSSYDIVAVRMNDNRLDNSFYQADLLPYVANGGVAVLSVSGYFDFKRIFGSSDFELKWTDQQHYSWKLRYVQSIKPGDWLHEPDNLEKGLESYCTPYSGYEISAGSKWQELASMRKKDGSSAPYILEMVYGKGKLLLTTGSIGLDDVGQWMTFGSSHLETVTALFNNLYAWKIRNRQQ